MRREEKRIAYPFSKSWVYLSGVLFFLSLIFMLMLSNGNTNVIGLYFLATFITATPAYMIKIRIYTRNVKDEHRLKRGITIRALVMLFLLGMALLFLPFVFLYFFGSHAWLILVNSYISGVNISEIIVYLIHCR